MGTGRSEERPAGTATAQLTISTHSSQCEPTFVLYPTTQKIAIKNNKAT